MTDLYTATAPVFKIDGEVRGGLALDVSRLEIEEATDGLKSMKLRLIAQGQAGNSPEERQLYLDGAVVDLGKRIEVSIGPADAARIVFTGSISGIEARYAEVAEPHVVLYAEDRLMELRMTRRMTTWRDMTDADIAAAIASKHGLQSDTAAPGPKYDVVQQWNQSDLAFLRERARLIQAELWFDGQTLYFKSRSNRGGTQITLVRGSDLLDLQLTADLAHQRTDIRVSGFDATAVDTIDEEGAADTIDAETSGGLTGPAVLKRSFGERVSYRVRQAPLLAPEARAFARAEMLRRSRGFVTAVGTTSGTPDMVVGSQLTLNGVGKPFEGDGYYAVRVRHSYGLGNGHRTYFEAQRATLNTG